MRYNDLIFTNGSWYGELNENFANLDTDVPYRGPEADRSTVTPDVGRRYESTDTGRVYYGDGSSWVHDETTGPRMYNVVTSYTDTDGTTPLNATITIPNPQEQQTYKLVGYLWGSNYSQGEGGEITASITVNGNTNPIYDYNTLDNVNGITNVSGDTAWKEAFWRRYKHPINFTISADSDPVAASDGNDSMFTSISSQGHTSERGLLNGRLGGGYASGGHPYGPLSSIEISTVDAIECKLVLYGMDWKSDL